MEEKNGRPLTRKWGSGCTPLTVRLRDDVYAGINKYAAEKNCSKALAMEELLCMGLEKVQQGRRAS